MRKRIGRLIDAHGALVLALGLLFVAPAARAADEPGAGPAVQPAAPFFPLEHDPLAGGAPGDPEALLVLARRDPVALGPLSIGTPDSGLLVNPMPMPSGSLWTVRNPLESWGTDETIDFIATAIEAVEARHPGSPRLVIGDLSRPDGGRLNRHRSHQAGRDADIGFYYRRGEVDTFLGVRRGELDLPRTWELVRALVTETDVERMFVDRSIISVLFAHAVEEGESRAWLDDIFGRRADDKGIIQHERRHKDHMHVRFYNPRAQERGRIVHAALVEDGVVPPPTVKHRVRRGETLGHLARRYGTSVAAIRAANGLQGTRLRAGRSYAIPVRKVPPEAGPMVVPPRRLPPELLALLVPPPATPLLDGAAGASPGEQP
jgi:penicillin-insensitive murein endopeptidase